MSSTVYVIGRGPSLARVVPSDIGPGSVIALNAAILAVRRWGIPNEIYSMQKDGCQPHGAVEPYAPPQPGHVCGLIVPEPPECLLVSAAESPYCLPDYAPRVVLDVTDDLGLPWHAMSATVAVALAISFGARQIVMLGHDAYTSGGKDVGRWMPDGTIETDPHAGYYLAGYYAADIADAAGVEMQWIVR